MSDPFAIFRNTPNRHGTLKALWPELYNCLAGTDKPEVPRERTCVIGDCPKRVPQPIAVARIDRWGHTACAMHIELCADRPGGWPLDIREHRR